MSLGENADKPKWLYHANGDILSFPAGAREQKIHSFVSQDYSDDPVFMAYKFS